MIENTCQHCPEAVFIFTSANKASGDTPSRLPLIEQATSHSHAVNTVRS